MICTDMDKEYKEALKRNGLTDAEVSRIFQYKSHGSFLRSSARDRIRRAVLEVIVRVEK